MSRALAKPPVGNRKANKRDDF